MNSARDSIFSAIRRSLKSNAGDAARRQSVEARLAASRPGIRPARGEGSLEERIATFTAQAQSVSATVVRLRSAAEAPGEVSAFLRGHNLPAAIRIGADDRLTGLDWKFAGLDVSSGPSGGGDLNAVSHAEGGAAETGTLALVSGAHNPSTLNFLPDNHIVIVRTAAILSTYEDILAQIRARFGKGVLPRTVNLVTGPSRSADIEQKLLLGAHGPRRLHILLVDGD
ncbi:MAG: lactate utilization protein C [Beijerinckiaceae bacterium]